VHLTFAVNTTAVSWIGAPSPACVCLLLGCRWLAQGCPHAAGRSTVKEVMALVMRKCVESTSPGDFARVEHELQGKKAYCFVVSRQVLPLPLHTPAPQPPPPPLPPPPPHAAGHRSELTAECVRRAAGGWCLCWHRVA